MIVKDVRSFFGYVGFCRRFIKDFSKIIRFIIVFMCKNFKFDFILECLKFFEEIKLVLIILFIV